eukprot:748321-Hanusia_phi.AAC.2
MASVLQHFVLMMQSLDGRSLDRSPANHSHHRAARTTNAEKRVGKRRSACQDRGFDLMLRLIFRFTLVTVAIANVEIDSRSVRTNSDHRPHCWLLTRSTSRLNFRYTISLRCKKNPHDRRRDASALMKRSTRCPLKETGVGLKEFQEVSFFPLLAESSSPMNLIALIIQKM